jgi:hypothetical protein
MGHDREGYTTKPKVLMGIDAEFFLRGLNARQEQQVFVDLAGSDATQMTAEEAETSSNKKGSKRGLRSGNPFSIF